MYESIVGCARAAAPCSRAVVVDRLGRHRGDTTCRKLLRGIERSRNGRMTDTSCESERLIRVDRSDR